MEPGCSMQKGWKTGKQTDMTKLIVAFRISANVFKNCMKEHKSLVPVGHLQRNSQRFTEYPVGGSNPSDWTASLCVFDLSALRLEICKSKTAHCEKWFVERKSDSQFTLPLDLTGTANAEIWYVSDILTTHVSVSLGRNTFCHLNLYPICFDVLDFVTVWYVLPKHLLKCVSYLLPKNHSTLFNFPCEFTAPELNHKSGCSAMVHRGYYRTPGTLSCRWRTVCLYHFATFLFEN
jgi:hypothetical protein